MSRTLRERLVLRAPALRRPLLALGLRVPHLPTRKRLALQALRDSAASFSRGDLEAAFAGLADDVELHPPSEFPDAQVLRGRQAVLAFYERTLSELTRVELRHGEVLRADRSGIVATYDLRFEGRETGLGFEVHGTTTFDVVRAEIVRMRATVERSRQL